MDDYESLIFNFKDKYLNSDFNSDPDVNFFNDVNTCCSYRYPNELKEFLIKNVNEKKKNQNPSH